MRLRRRAAAAIAVILAALIALMTRLSGVAAADGTVVLGGGAGITVNGTNCTLTTIGHDGSSALVGFTAATCGGPGSSVNIEAGPGGIGDIVAANDELDYAVIKFDPAKVVPTASFAVSGSTASAQTLAALDSRSAHRGAPPVSVAVSSSSEAPNRASSRRTCRRGNPAITGHRSPLTANWSASPAGATVPLFSARFPR